MADEKAKVEGQTGAAKVGQVFGISRFAGTEIKLHGAFGIGHNPAIAGDLGGNPLTELAFPLGFCQPRQRGVGVDIDEAGGENQAPAVDDLPGGNRGGGQVDFIPLYGHGTATPRPPGTIHHQAV